jgi:hypothetical protein
MMERIPSPRGRFKSFVIGLCILSLVLSNIVSCELFKEDYFPAYLGQAQATQDLATITRAAGISSSATVGFLQFIPVPAIQKTYIVLGLHQTAGPNAIVLLDSSDLSVIKAFIILTPIGKFALLDMDGYITTGYDNTYVTRINPVTLTPVSLYINPAPFFSQTGFSITPLVQTSYLCEMSESGITLMGYSSAWSAQTYNSLQSNIFTNQSATNFSLLDLWYDGSRVYMALNNNNTNTGYIIRWDDFAQFTTDFNSSYSIGSNAAQIVQVPVSREEGAFLTSAGCIVQFKDNAKGLGRYALDRDNVELDRFPLPHEFRGKISFARDGSRWLMYDERKGTIVLLRPWW